MFRGGVACIKDFPNTTTWRSTIMRPDSPTDTVHTVGVASVTGIG